MPLTSCWRGSSKYGVENEEVKNEYPRKRRRAEKKRDLQNTTREGSPQSRMHRTNEEAESKAVRPLAAFRSKEPWERVLGLVHVAGR